LPDFSVPESLPQDITTPAPSSPQQSEKKIDRVTGGFLRTISSTRD
jgi:hypothetical protein